MIILRHVRVSHLLMSSC